MAGYQVNSLETCADGFERLRYQDEFILLAYPGGNDESPESIVDDWIQDMDSCARPDGFDYEAAERAVRQWAADNRPLIEAELATAEFPTEEEADMGESVTFRLYVQAPSPELAG